LVVDLDQRLAGLDLDPDFLLQLTLKTTDDVLASPKLSPGKFPKTLQVGAPWSTANKHAAVLV
jgi:hypothetical protein